MCQFFSCQPHKEKKSKLFQPLSAAAAANVRAGWWAYYSNGAYSAVSLDHSNQPQGVFMPLGQSSLTQPIKANTPTYGYGYGTDF